MPLVHYLSMGAPLLGSDHAGQTDRPWTLARAGFWSPSLLWFHVLAVLVAISPLVRESHLNHS
jgi:hypothetical protein